MIQPFIKRIDLQVFSKVLFVLYVVYTNVLDFTLFHIQFLSIVLLIGAVVLELIHDHLRIRIDRSLLALVFFTLYALISGSLIAENFDRVLNSSISLTEWLIVFYLILSYSLSDGNPHFSMAVFNTQAITTAMFMILSGTGLKRISISESVNVNTIGMTFAFSIGYILYFLIDKKNKPIKWVISIGAIAALLIGIMMTSSKKAIIGGAALIILWIVLCYRFTFARIHKVLRILIIVGIIAVGIFVYRWYTSAYALQTEIMLYRMSGLYVGDSDQARIEMIKEGFLVFLSHPFFGVGFNNARYYISYATYTHCLYTEVLACTGIVGTLLFGYAVVRPWMIIVKTRNNIKQHNSFLNTRIIYLLAIFTVFLLSNFMQIAFYAQNLMYTLSVFAAFAANLKSDYGGLVMEHDKD